MASRAPIERFDNLWASSVGDVCLFVARGKRSERETRQGARWIFQHVDALAKRVGGDVVLVMLVFHSADPPDGAARDELRKQFARCDAVLRRTVMTPIGESWWASLVRALARGVSLVGPRAIAVADGVEEAITLALERRGPCSPTAVALRVSVDALMVTTAEEGPGASR